MGGVGGPCGAARTHPCSSRRENVATEPHLLVALLTVRTLGGQSAPANHEVVKGLKKVIQQAVEKGLLEEKTVTEEVAVEGKTKPKKVKTKVVALTEQGERTLRESADPQALAATQGGALAAAVEALRRGLDADREALRQQVRAALAGPGKDKEAEKASKEAGKLGKDVEKIARAVEALTEKVRLLEEKQPRPRQGAESLTAKIEEGFAALRAKLDQALHGLPKPTAPAPAGHHAAPASHHAAPAAHPPAAPKVAPPPEQPPPKPAEPESLPRVLQHAYDELKAHHREYQEGMVELPRLYHEARRARPELTVADFQREILALEGKRVIDLHIRNEVQGAPEPEKAIKRNDKLYYFVYWSRA
jgi:hypothetical protein